jgi:hypothetical protein
VKAHYGGQKLLSQISLFETTCFWTFTKLILKRFFANGTWNKVVQTQRIRLLKKNLNLKLILNDQKIY